MTREIDRCRWALEAAQSGKAVALACSGDAGVYGMASPLLELAGAYPDVEVEIVPGLTAALSGAAVLGAPLAHDFCVISLSDRLTPWEVIEKRLACAAAGDFCVALYNPSSKGARRLPCQGCAHPASKRQGGRDPLRRRAQHRARRTILLPADAGGVGADSGGYVHDGLCR